MIILITTAVFYFFAPVKESPILSVENLRLGSNVNENDEIDQDEQLNPKSSSAEVDGDGGESKTGEKSEKTSTPGPFNNWDVVEVYNSLPDEYKPLGNYDIKQISQYERLLIDEDNYFMELAADIVSVTAVFLKTSGGAVVASSTVGCGPLCHQDLVFLEYVDGEWIDVSDAVFPQIDSGEMYNKFTEKYKEKFGRDFNYDADIYNFLYEIPRFGTRINIYDLVSDTDFAALKWTGTRFDLIWK